MTVRPEIDGILASIAPLAPLGYCIKIHIRDVSPLIQFSTLGGEWRDHYAKNGFALRDPTVAWGYASQGACRWNEMPIPDHIDYFGDAAAFGLNYGATVSCGSMLSRSLANFVRSDREFSEGEMAELERMIVKLHGLLRPPDKLTDAQIEALKIVANGDRHTAAASKLKISESAFKARLVAARKRLSARTTAEAIQRAKDYGFI